MPFDDIQQGPTGSPVGNDTGIGQGRVENVAPCGDRDGIEGSTDLRDARIAQPYQVFRRKSAPTCKVDGQRRDGLFCDGVAGDGRLRDFGNQAAREM